MLWNDPLISLHGYVCQLSFVIALGVTYAVQAHGPDLPPLGPAGTLQFSEVPAERETCVGARRVAGSEDILRAEAEVVHEVLVPRQTVQQARRERGPVCERLAVVDSCAASGRSIHMARTEPYRRREHPRARQVTRRCGSVEGDRAGIRLQ